MDALREVVVELQFIRGPNSDVLARTITYVGYTGVLTGTRYTYVTDNANVGLTSPNRPGLSLSLNFRAEHDHSTYVQNVRYFWHVG